MKLGLKHFSAYLPYGLKCEVINWDAKISRYRTTISELHAVYSDGSCVFHDLVESEHGFESIMPILTPLSAFESDDIAKVKEYVGAAKWCEAYDEYFDIWFDDPANADKLVLQAPYEIVQYFLENHIDIYGLIQEGLATDVNKLK